MLEFYTLTGTVDDGVVHLHDISDEVAKYLKKDTFYDEAFRVIDNESEISFTVEYNSVRQTPFKLLENSIQIITAAGEEIIEGWCCVAGVWFSPEEFELFEAASEIASNGGKQYNLMLTGGSGYGKTARAKAWSHYKDMTYIRLNVALLRNEQAIFGVAGVKNNETVFNPTEAAKAMQQGNAVVLLDEANRAHSNILNGVYSILDDERSVWLNTPAGNFDITVGENVIFVATVNLGYQFTGTFEMDSAFRKRFSSFVEVAAPPMPVEVKLLQERLGLNQDTSETIVIILDRLRSMTSLIDSDIDITTRKALQIGQLAKTKLSLRNAFKISLINSAPDNVRKHITDVINAEGL